MKKLLLTMILGAAFAFGAQGQNGIIPNGGFEGGVVGTSTITGWETFNKTTLVDSQTIALPGGGSKDVVASEGNTFVEMVTDTTTIGGQLYYQFGLARTRFAYAGKPDSMRIDLMYLPVTTADRFLILFNLTKWNTTTNQRDTVVKNVAVNGPAGTVLVNAGGNGWLQYTINMGSLTIPSDYDSITISLRSSGIQTSYQAGASFWADNIRFYKTAVGVVEETQVSFSNDFGVYPNPFTTTTNIRYTLNQNEMVNLQVYDAQGRLVSTLVNENQAAGQHIVQFDATGMEPGVYFYRLNAGDAVRTERMILAK